MVYDQNRHYDRCVLCGRAPRPNKRLEKEHLFSKSYAKRWRQSKPAQTSEARIGVALLDFAPRLLCSRCNRRLGKNVEAVLPTLNRFTNGRFAAVSQSIATHLQTYLTRLALLVDVVTSTLGGNRSTRLEVHNSEHHKRPPIVPDELRTQWISDKRTQVPVHAYIGYHDGVFGLMQTCNVRHHVSLDLQTGARKPAKTFSVVIERLAMVATIGVASTEELVPSSFGEVHRGQSWQPPRVPASYLDVLALYNLDEEIRSVVNQLASPVGRRVLEKEAHRDNPPKGEFL